MTGFAHSRLARRQHCPCPQLRSSLSAPLALAVLQRNRPYGLEQVRPSRSGLEDSYREPEALQHLIE